MTDEPLDDVDEAVRGSDGLTPRERLEARGFEFDEDGTTRALGYGHPDRDPAEWAENHRPRCTFTCGGDHKFAVAEAWILPTSSDVPDAPGAVWLRTGMRKRTPRQVKVDAAFVEALMNCPVRDGYADIAAAYAEAEPRRPTPYVSPWQGTVAEAEDIAGPGLAMFQCPNHGAVLVPSAWVEDETRHPRSDKARVRCTEPSPRYTRRS